MLKFFLFNLLILISFMMLFLNHPLSMGLLILIQTLLLSLTLGFFMKTYWFSYILFLTFLGGLLVLFIYVSSVASNEMFKISYLLNMFFFFLTLIIFFLSLFMFNNMNILNYFFNLEMMDFFQNFSFFNNENKMNLSKLYNSHTYLLMMMMIIYLFITLIAVVKITNIFFGALRTSY